MGITGFQCDAGLGRFINDENLTISFYAKDPPRRNATEYVDERLL